MPTLPEAAGDLDKAKTANKLVWAKLLKFPHWPALEISPDALCKDEQSLIQGMFTKHRARKRGRAKAKEEEEEEDDDDDDDQYCVVKFLITNDFGVCKREDVEAFRADDENFKIFTRKNGLGKKFRRAVDLALEISVKAAFDDYDGDCDAAAEQEEEEEGIERERGDFVMDEGERSERDDCEAPRVGKKKKDDDVMSANDDEIETTTTTIETMMRKDENDFL